MVMFIKLVVNSLKYSLQVSVELTELVVRVMRLIPFASDSFLRVELIAIDSFDSSFVHSSTGPKLPLYLTSQVRREASS